MQNAGRASKPESPGEATKNRASRPKPVGSGAEPAQVNDALDAEVQHVTEKVGGQSSKAFASKTSQDSRESNRVAAATAAQHKLDIVMTPRQHNELSDLDYLAVLGIDYWF